VNFRRNAGYIFQTSSAPRDQQVTGTAAEHAAEDRGHGGDEDEPRNRRAL